MDNKLLNQLFTQFRDEDLEWRYWNYDQVNRDGEHRVVPYIKPMSIRKRLDEVLGVANWKQTVTPGGAGVACSLSIRINGEWISRDSYAEGSANTAFTRAAADLGIGRYLYDLPMYYANYVVAGTEGSIEIEAPGYGIFYHIPPKIHTAVVAQAPVAESKPIRPTPRVNIDKQVIRKGPVTQQSQIAVNASAPSINQAPFGSKSEIEQIKQEQAGPQQQAQVLPIVTGVRTSRSTPVSKPVAGIPEQDVRPFAYEKLRFGYHKGKRFRELSENDWIGLITWMNESLQYPTSKPVIEDRKKMLAFLNITMKDGVIELPKKREQA